MLRRKRKSRSKRDLLKNANKKKRRRSKAKGANKFEHETEETDDEPSEKCAPKRGVADDDKLVPKAKAKSKAKAKAAPKAKGKPKAKAKAKAKPFAKGKAKGKAKKPPSHGQEVMEPDPSGSGYSACGNYVLGCPTCRWSHWGCQNMCLRPKFRGTRWNAVACPEE